MSEEFSNPRLVEKDKRSNKVLSIENFNIPQDFKGNYNATDQKIKDYTGEINFPYLNLKDIWVPFRDSFEKGELTSSQDVVDYLTGKNLLLIKRAADFSKVFSLMVYSQKYLNEFEWSEEGESHLLVERYISYKENLPNGQAKKEEFLPNYMDFLERKVKYGLVSQIEISPIASRGIEHILSPIGYEQKEDSSQGTLVKKLDLNRISFTEKDSEFDI